MKKILKIMLSVFLVAITFSYKVFASETENIIEEGKVQETAASQYELLIDSFPENRSSGKKIYPESYGGSFIDDSGILNIYQKEIDEGTQTETYSITDEDVVYVDCKYSYNDLLNEMEKIKQYCIDNKDDEITNSMVEYGIYDSENCIKVYLLNYSDDIINKFKSKISNSSAIIFEQGNKVNSTASVKAGSKVGISASNYGSVDIE